MGNNRRLKTEILIIDVNLRNPNPKNQIQKPNPYADLNLNPTPKN